MNEGRMNFEEFTESVRDSIRDHLPAQYRGAEVRISEFQKLNKSYTSLQVVSSEHAPVPNINLDSYFEAYRNGSMGMDDIMKNISKQLEEEPPLDTDWLMDYGQVKDKLCIRLADAKENESFLRNKPHKEVDGLAVTYNVVFNTPDGMSASVPVNNNMMKMYGISEEQLHADALASSQTLFPATCVSLAKMMGDMMGLDADTVMPTMDEPQLMVLTNDQAFHGAGALFYPGQMEAIASQLGSDYFILPSSIHEVLLLPDDGTVDADVLNFMIQDINLSTVAPEERLANEAYHYDAKDHVLEKAATYNIRMEKKEREAEKAVLQAAKGSSVKETAKTEKDVTQEARSAESAGRESQGGERKPETGKHKESQKRERKSVLARLNDKKQKLQEQPKKDTPMKNREAAI